MKSVLSAPLLLAGLTLAGLSACAPQPTYPPPVVYVAPPPPPPPVREAAPARGTNTIFGRALMRAPDGGVVTCAGDGAILLRATTATRRRLDSIYGRGRDFIPISEAGKATGPRPAEVQRSRCSEDGAFRFTGVPNGTYIVTAGIRGAQRATMRREVTVRGGQTREVVMEH